MEKLLTKEQVNKRYRGRYIEVYSTYDYTNQCKMYRIIRTFGKIHENTTLGEDVGTALAYRR